MYPRAGEKWLPVIGFEGLYEVSNLGAIYSHRRSRLLHPHKDADGYLRIGLWDGETQRKYAVHKLVAAAFHADKKNVLHNEVAHLDGNRSNPRADNLKWVSKAENRSHQKLHGTDPIGERHGRAKLTEAAVRHIRSTADSRASLATLYGVSPWAIDDVRSRKRWKHVQECHG